jgi:hypothetical protein
MEIGNIVNGHINEMLGLNKDISQQRMKVCYKCPLFSPKFGGWCNNKLYIDPNTNDISAVAKDGNEGPLSDELYVPGKKYYKDNANFKKSTVNV